MRTLIAKCQNWLRGRAGTGSKRSGKALTSRVRATAFESLEGREMMAVTYHGGALMPHVQAQNVFLGDAWRTNENLKSQAHQLDRFVSYLVDSPYMDMLENAGYRVGRGSATPGILGPDVNGTIRDIGIQGKIQSLITTSTVAAPTPNRLYIVFTEPGIIVSESGDTSVDSFLGYHGAFAGRTAAGARVDIRYAVMPYPGRPNPSPVSQGYNNAFDELTSVTSHEIAEAVTDPNVGYKRLGWYDDRRDGEIADFTDANVRLNGYLVQKVSDKSGRDISPFTIFSGLPIPTLNRKTANSTTVVAAGSVDYYSTAYVLPCKA